MKTIVIKDIVGTFAENKDLARDIRLKEIIPSLQAGEKVILDFSGVTSATQSFIHALISDLFRRHGASILDSITFKSCNETVQKIITIVADYMQESE